MNPFRDQEKFMNACDQSTDTFNKDQFNLYLDLMEEEWKELGAAIMAKDKKETLDALLDFVVVTITGYSNRNIITITSSRSTSRVGINDSLVTITSSTITEIISIT